MSSNVAATPTPEEVHLTTLIGNYFRNTGRHWLSRMASRLDIKDNPKISYGMTDGKTIFLNVKNIMGYDLSFQYGLITHELWHNVLNHCNIDVYVGDMSSVSWTQLVFNDVSTAQNPKVLQFMQEVNEAHKDADLFLKFCMTRPVMKEISNIVYDGIINEIISRPEHPKGFGELPIGQSPESTMVTYVRKYIQANPKAAFKYCTAQLLAEYIEELLNREQQNQNSGDDNELSADNFRISQKELEEVCQVVNNPSIVDEIDDEGCATTSSRSKGKAKSKAVSNYWSPALQRFLVSRLSKGAGKTTVNRRKLPRDIYQRQHHLEQKMLKLTIMSDVSGSIDQSMLDTFYGNVRRIVGEIHPENLTLVTWDTRICDEVHYHKVTQLPEEFPLAAHGGGTNIQCVGYWLQERLQKDAFKHNTQELIIIFTDMAFNLPQIAQTFPKGIEVIWAAFDIYRKNEAVACINKLPQHSLFQLKDK